MMASSSQNHIIPEGTPIFYNQPIQGPVYWPSVQHVNPHGAYSDDVGNGNDFEPYNALESSLSGTGNYQRRNNSSSCVSLSANGSPVSQLNNSQSCGTPVSGSCVTDNEADFRLILKELETAMLEDSDEPVDVGNYEIPPGPDGVISEMEKRRIDAMISRGDLKGVLCACAKAIDNDDKLTTQWLVAELNKMVSVHGEPIQRLGAYILEGLIAKLVASGSLIYKASRCREPTGPELLTHMHILYEACPYFKFGYESANGAIAEAMKDENFVHIIDFQISQGGQWVSLIRALAARPGGPPRIRITGIDDPTSAFARQGGLEIVGQRLSRLAELCKVPFEFHAAALSGSEVQLESLKVRTGEAIAANFPLMLHHMPDESVCVENHRDRLLRLVKCLSPKVVTLVEQEANTNTSPFYTRFVETMNYYLAVFESVDVKLPRDHRERVSVEQDCLAREIVNLIACEGIERVERHEPLGKWRSRFLMAGFEPYPLSSYVNATIKTLLESYSEKYTLEERDGVLYLGWMDRPLVTSCAWR